MLRPDDVSVHLRSLLRFCARGLDASCSSVLEFAKNCVSFVRVLALCSAPAASVWRPAPYTSFPVRMRLTAHDTHRESFLDEHAWPLICGIRRCEKEEENVLKFPGNVTALEAPSLPLLCLAFPPSPADTAAFSLAQAVRGKWLTGTRNPSCVASPWTVHKMQSPLSVVSSGRWIAEKHCACCEERDHRAGHVVPRYSGTSRASS